MVLNTHKNYNILNENYSYFHLQIQEYSFHFTIYIM